MNKTQFDSTPSLVTNEGRTILIAFGAEEVTVTPSTTPSEATDTESSDSGSTESDSTRTVYEAYAVRVSLPTTYEQITSAIIDAAYPSDQMQAIINNHLLESDNAEHEAEFTAMQEWRTNAKAIAKQVMEQFQASLQQ